MIDHLAVAVKDVDAAHEFYTGAMGFELVKVVSAALGKNATVNLGNRNDDFGTALATLFKKELLDVLRNRAALVPIVVAAAVALAMPFSIAILVPSAAHQPLGSDAELSRISRIVDSGVLSENARVQLFLFQQFLLVFLLMPITGAMSLAAHAIVGEKQARTLEPLLATPLTTFELLV